MVPTRSLGGHRPSGPSAAAPPAPGPGSAPSGADGTRRPPKLTSGGRYGGLLAFPPRLRPFFFFVFEPPLPPGAAPPRPRSAAPAPPPAGRQQPPNSSDTRESMADTAAPPPRCSARSAPRPAPPARLRPRRHRPPRGAPGKRVPPAYNTENAPRATRSKLHLPACPAAQQLAPVRVPSAGADRSWSPRERAPPVGRSRQCAGCRRSPGSANASGLPLRQFTAPGSLVIDMERSVRLASGNWGTFEALWHWRYQMTTQRQQPNTERSQRTH